MSIFRFTAIFAVLVAFAGLAGAQPPVNPKVPVTDPNADETYRIGFQDTLEIQVFTRPELNQRVTLSPDGTIRLFRSTKPIVALCKTERELAREIEAEYLKFLRKPEVNVFAIEKKSQSFGVIGAVEKAGTYYVNRRIRLIELLSFAGGPNKEAGTRMIIARTGSTSACEASRETSDDGLQLMNFRLKDVLEAKANPWMQPGDVVSVLDADVVYVYGNVNKVGSVTMKEPITLTQAIVSAEGLKPTAKTTVRILRQKPDSLERIELPFDLKEIEKRKVNDPYLEPNDIVAVSQDSTKTVLKGIKEVIQQGIPGFIYRF